MWRQSVLLAIAISLSNCQYWAQVRHNSKYHQGYICYQKLSAKIFTIFIEFIPLNENQTPIVAITTRYSSIN